MNVNLKIKITFLLGIFAWNAATAQLQTEEISLSNGNFAIDGELSYITTKKTPLIIYISGSGNIDRNGNQGTQIQADYIRQLAQALNKREISVFRYDKRTANSKNISFLDDSIRLDDFVSDVQLILAHFANDERFTDINLLGHSQGSLVAMLATDVRVQRFISVAGASETVEETLIAQLHKQSPALSSKAREHFRELMATDTIRQVHPFLNSIFMPVNQRFLKSYNQYHPIEIMSKITIPSLIINGTNDLQVPPDDARKLNAVAPQSRLVIIENMTHVLKITQNRNEILQTYLSPDYPIANQLVDEIADFVTQP
ncbi:MAG: alpha/beta fold hydrolase [Capnocytophaga sp.]|nr:alpha/beta fold hydrolase [Capnocytophaga sp.]